jgi:hypothetical protein
MKYTVEFEIHTDLADTVNAWVYNTLKSTFGTIDGFKVTPVNTYICYFDGSQPIVWRELRSVPARR